MVLVLEGCSYSYSGKSRYEGGIGGQGNMPEVGYSPFTCLVESFLEYGHDPPVMVRSKVHQHVPTTAVQVCNRQ